MYVFPRMLELTKQKWPSKTHKKVAEAVLLCNPSYTSLTLLKEGAEIIASIPKNEIKKVTPVDLWKKGIKFA